MDWDGASESALGYGVVLVVCVTNAQACVRSRRDSGNNLAGQPTAAPRDPHCGGRRCACSISRSERGCPELGFTHGRERPCQPLSRRPGSFCAPAAAALSLSAAPAIGVSAIAAPIVRAWPELAPNVQLVSATRTAAKAVMHMPGAKVNGGRVNKA